MKQRQRGWEGERGLARLSYRRARGVDTCAELQGPVVLIPHQDWSMGWRAQVFSRKPTGNGRKRFAKKTYRTFALFLQNSPETSGNFQENVIQESCPPVPCYLWREREGCAPFFHPEDPLGSAGRHVKHASARPEVGSNARGAPDQRGDCLGSVLAGQRGSRPTHGRRIWTSERVWLEEIL